jgi:hypothetical protein
MRKPAFFFFLIIALPVLCANHVLFTADKVSIFPNPERGFTEELGGETKLSDSKNHVVKSEMDWFFDPEDENYADRKNQSLVMLMYYLYNYKTKDLSEKLLQGFDEDMQILREHGFKCVLRFAYDWNSKNDAELTWVKRHIAQLAPHWEKNKDVIYVLETGFVGQWGEWYYSSHFGNETQALTDSRKQVLKAMLDACPPDRFLLVRYPLIKLSYLGDEVPLDSTEAFSSSARARIGHHNDAFLADWGNDGTYGRNGNGPDDDPVLRNYIAKETLFVPNGGETNVEGSSNAQKIYANAPDEMSRYHWSFCGAQYSEDVTNRWRTSGIFDELNRKMGYRYELIEASLPESVEIGEKMAISISLRNVGYAPLYNPRPVYLVLKDAQHTFLLPMQTDPRRWLPNGVETVIEETLECPVDIPVGNYALYLYMPDAATSIADNPKYAVRFANIGTWNEKTGMNSLMASLNVAEKNTENMLDTYIFPQSRKELRNGQLLIIHGGESYTILGYPLSR